VEARIVTGGFMIKPVVLGIRRGLLLPGLMVVAGCSWKAKTPTDYIPPEEPSEPWIIAIPNPVPAGRGPGKTIVNWYTGDGSPGQVYVSIGGGPERLFSDGSSHRETVINGRDEYEFRLYAGNDRATRLATVKVTRDQPTGIRLPPGRDRWRRGN
jgi:hypothetical protein